MYQFFKAVKPRYMENFGFLTKIMHLDIRVLVLIQHPASAITFYASIGKMKNIEILRPRTLA